MSSANDFVIENGVLKEYTGPGGDVVIPEGVTSIGERAFSWGSSLTSVTIPHSVTSIAYGAFSGCISLTDITIPNSVMSIGERAFSGCVNLTSVAIPDNVTSIGAGAFQGCSGLQDEHGFVMIHGVLYFVDKDAVSVVIPEGVTCIGDSAFEANRRLNSVTIPYSVTSIGKRAFSGCSSLKDVEIPNSVTSIGEYAFSDCSSLKSVEIPNSVTSIDAEAFRGCSGLQNGQGFVIIHGVLYDCADKDVVSVVIPEGVTGISDEAFSGCRSLTDVTIPQGVTSIGKNAFYECSNLTSVTIPDSVTSIGNSAFYSCGNLREVTLPLAATSGRMFGRSGKTIILTVTRPDREPLRAVASFRKDYWEQTWEYEQNYLLPLDENTALAYDRLVAAGSYEGFQMNEEGRIRAALWRLEDCQLPVSDEFRGMFEDFLQQKVNKVLKLAEADSRASYILTLVAVGAINEGNLKKVKKAVSASAVPEIRAMADSLTPAAQQPESSQSNIEPHLAARLKQINATAVLLKCGVSTLPEVKRTDGTVADADYLRLILAEYVPQNCGGISPLAEEAAEKLDRDSLREALLTVYSNVKNEKNQLALLLPLFRYADGALVQKLYPSFRGAAWKEKIGDMALLLSDTREAMLLADKRGLLDDYAWMRGTSADALRDTALSDLGLDENWKKSYDLGGRTVTACVGQDLKVALYDETAGKAVKSIPKSGADPEKYEKANEDISKLKKTVRDIAGKYKTQLFQKFLSGEKIGGADWKAAYLKNPVLNMTARLLVWKQGGKTFTLSTDGPINSTGKPYTVTDKPVVVAHPMEMKADDLQRWQNYFVFQALKQPFEQVWEPVIDPADIRPDRYDGLEVSVFQFMRREKHGIFFYDADFHNEIGFSLEGCDLGFMRTTYHRDEIARDETFTLGKFSFKKYTRKVNHIVALLDRWTAAGRILKDDVSVREALGGFTAAQITEFIGIATQNHCPNCAAMLLEYKQEHYPNFDPLTEFTLEL